jgi:hypothetical protein
VTIPTGESEAARVGRTNNTIAKQTKKGERKNNHLQQITPKTKE